eukprot:406477-Pyramimonas_sp.AAC.1
MDKEKADLLQYIREHGRPGLQFMANTARISETELLCRIMDVPLLVRPPPDTLTMYAWRFTPNTVGMTRFTTISTTAYTRAVLATVRDVTIHDFLKFSHPPWTTRYLYSPIPAPDSIVVPLPTPAPDPGIHPKFYLGPIPVANL